MGRGRRLRRGGRGGRPRSLWQRPPEGEPWALAPGDGEKSHAETQRRRGRGRADQHVRRGLPAMLGNRGDPERKPSDTAGLAKGGKRLTEYVRSRVIIVSVPSHLVESILQLAGCFPNAMPLLRERVPLE